MRKERNEGQTSMSDKQLAARSEGHGCLQSVLETFNGDSNIRRRHEPH